MQAEGHNLQTLHKVVLQRLGDSLHWPLDVSHPPGAPRHHHQRQLRGPQEALPGQRSAVSAVAPRPEAGQDRCVLPTSPLAHPALL